MTYIQSIFLGDVRNWYIKGETVVFTIIPGAYGCISSVICLIALTGSCHHLPLLGTPLDDPIQCMICDGRRMFTGAGHDLQVWKRGKKVLQRVFYFISLLCVYYTG